MRLYASFSAHSLTKPFRPIFLTSRLRKTSIRPYPTSHLHTTPTTPAQTTTMASTSDPLTIPPSQTPLDGIESAKRKAAFHAIHAHFSSTHTFIGIGSGSTIVYGVEAIKHHLTLQPPASGRMLWFVPTGWNSRKVIESFGLIPIAFDSLPANTVLDVCFDGADEVDEELNCIKGGGACLFQEKLVACRSKKFVCIADYRKDQRRLLTKWKSVPIEVAPIAHASVLRSLKLLGSTDAKLREHSLAKTGPIQTDQSFYIIDAEFPPLLTSADIAAGKDGSGKNGVWEVETLARRIKEIVGVLEVGLFCGLDGVAAQAQGAAGQGGQKPVAVYFGAEDGGVVVKRRGEGGKGCVEEKLG